MEEVDNKIFVQLIKRLISTVVSGLLKMLYGLGELAELFEEAPDSEEQVATFKSFLAIQHPVGLTLCEDPCGQRTFSLWSFMNPRSFLSILAQTLSFPHMALIGNLLAWSRSHQWNSVWEMLGRYRVSLTWTGFYLHVICRIYSPWREVRTVSSLKLRLEA